MTAYGSRLQIGMDEEGYLNLSFPDLEEPAEEEGEAEGEFPEDGEDMLREDNPFLESDLPLPQLAELNGTAGEEDAPPPEA